MGISNQSVHSGGITGNPATIRPSCKSPAQISDPIALIHKEGGNPIDPSQLTMNTNDLLRMFAYDHWANRECLRAMRQHDCSSIDTLSTATLASPARAAAAPAATVMRMAHILSAEKLWLERIRKETQSMPVWPNATIEDCQALADEIASAWRNHLSGLAPDDLVASVEYHNSKGEMWSSRVEDVLMHVLMHSAYHRGQVALELRSAGIEPAYTDFIHAVRQGFVR